MIKVVPPDRRVTITDELGNDKTVVQPSELELLHEDKASIRETLMFVKDDKYLREMLGKDLLATNRAIRKLTEEQGTLRIVNSAHTSDEQHKVEATRKQCE